FRPQLAENGRVIVRASVPLSDSPTRSQRLRLYSATSAGVGFVREIACDQPDCTSGGGGGQASPAGHLKALGRATGISDDGKMAAWVAQNADGPTLFACTDADAATPCKTFIRIAGGNLTTKHPELGTNINTLPIYFKDLDMDQRVGVIHGP